MSWFMRNCADTICQEQLSDLGDAIHNVPHSLIYYGENLNEATIRDLFLAAYDQKWANSDGDFSLLRALDAAENRREN